MFYLHKLTNNPRFGWEALIKMQGRLGNQMFIYAFGKFLHKKFGIKPIYDTSECGYSKGFCFELPKYNLKIKTKNLNYVEILNDKYKSLETNFGFFNPCIMPALYYEGYYQTEEYFKEFREDLIEDFRFKKPFDEEYKKALNDIESSNSVLLNFRVAEDYKKLGWVLDFSYQQEAMKYIMSKVNNPKFFVFADNIEYVKENFKTDCEITFVDIGKNNPDKIYFDLELMKRCKHAIIPNSTFSWWAAWLNENPQKIIIAPKPWFFKDSEIVPSNWIQQEAKKVYCKNPHIA